MSEEKTLQYLELPANELLERFGEGNHVPGSGSAAAFSALLGIELMKTVCKLTLTREQEKYIQNRTKFRSILDQLSEAKQELIGLFQKDAETFNLVSEYRVKRDEAKKVGDKTSERRNARLANEKLREATVIPLEIARTCLRIIDFGFTIFDEGFQSARGDSGVGISNLLSSISGSLFVTLLNIRTARSSDWTEQLRIEAEKIGLDYNIKQKQALTKVLDLYKEGIVQDDYQLKLNFD